LSGLPADLPPCFVMDYTKPGLGSITIFTQDFFPNGTLLPPSSLEGTIGNTAPERARRRCARPLSSRGGLTNGWAPRAYANKVQPEMLPRSAPSGIRPEHASQAHHLKQAASASEPALTPYQNGYIKESPWLLNKQIKSQRRAPVISKGVNPEEALRLKEEGLAKMWDANKDYRIKRPQWEVPNHPYQAERAADPTRGVVASRKDTSYTCTFKSKSTKLKCFPDGTPPLYRARERLPWPMYHPRQYST